MEQSPAPAGRGSSEARGRSCSLHRDGAELLGLAFLLDDRPDDTHEGDYRPGPGFEVGFGDASVGDKDATSKGEGVTNEETKEGLLFHARTTPQNGGKSQVEIAFRFVEGFRYGRKSRP